MFQCYNGNRLPSRKSKAADLNRNGKQDLIISLGRDSNRVLLNEHFSSVSESIELPKEQNELTRGIAVADLNRDGLLDIVVANDVAPPWNAAGNPSEKELSGTGVYIYFQKPATDGS